MNANEISRRREQGTVVTNTSQSVAPDLARIAAVRAIVTNSQYAKIDGVMVDLFTASAILAVYDALNEKNQIAYRAFNVGKMGLIAFKLLK